MHNEFYQNYNGTIPDNLRKTFLHGSIENYRLAFLTTAEKNFTRRFHEILRSLCVWRMAQHYPETVQTKMLKILSNGLFQARALAILAWLDLHQNSSASAVIAPPINTA